LLHITPLCHLPICKLGDVQNLKKGKEVVYTPSAPCRSSRTLLFVRLLLTNSAANLRVSKILIRMPLKPLQVFAAIQVWSHGHSVLSMLSTAKTKVVKVCLRAKFVPRHTCPSVTTFCILCSAKSR
jgi:hypothetical protein